MRKLTMMALSAVVLGLAGAAGTPASAAPIGNVATLPDRTVTGANPLLDKVHWRRYRHCHWRHGWRRCHGGYRRHYRHYSYGGYPYYYGGPGIHFRFGGHRHRHYRHHRFGRHHFGGGYRGFRGGHGFRGGFGRGGHGGRWR
jgi:hypothetical protein